MTSRNHLAYAGSSSEVYGREISMSWLRSLFGPHIVALSEPYSDGGSWSYIFGNETEFEIRKFPTAEDAHDSYAAALMGLRVGSPEVSLKLINLDLEQTRSVAWAGTSYREIIAIHLQAAAIL
jgi:hypothetical protein